MTRRTVVGASTRKVGAARTGAGHWARVDDGGGGGDAPEALLEGQFLQGRGGVRRAGRSNWTAYAYRVASFRLPPHCVEILLAGRTVLVVRRKGVRLDSFNE